MYNFVQMMNTLQRQQHALNQKISRLTAENQQFRQAGSPGLAEIATAVGQAVQTAIYNANRRTDERQSPIDNESLGKPPTFREEYARFTEWLRKTTGSLTAAHGSAFSPVIEWVEDQDTVITKDMFWTRVNKSMLYCWLGHKVKASISFLEQYYQVLRRCDVWSVVGIL